jgi:SAM-dependent methyltransferase
MGCEMPEVPAMFVNQYYSDRKIVALGPIFRLDADLRWVRFVGQIPNLAATYGKKDMRGFIYDQMRRRTSPQLRLWLKNQGWFTPLLPLIFGSTIYSESYYDQIERFEAASVSVIAKWINENLKPTSVIDVGCGPGHFLSALRNHEIRVLGIDYSEASQHSVNSKGHPFIRFDLLKEKPLPGSPWDLVVCCEVAEHLDPQYADVFLDNLTSGGNLIFMTAAEPGGGGLNHVNEQPNSYWIMRLERRGFVFESNLTERARAVFLEKGVVHYLAKPMIFRRSSAQITSRAA